MIRIITDTGSDMTLTQAAAQKVDLVSLRVHFDGEPYEQLADESFERFYTLLEENKHLPVTSQPPPADYLNLYAKAKIAGDEVIVITLSGGLSGTYQSAVIAADMLDYDKIYVVDSRSAIMGQRLLVDYAVQMRDMGRTAGEIAAVLTEAAGRIILYGALDTLKYLRKGGRIPRTAEVVGTMMGIKPVVMLENGKIEMAGKARGQAGAITTMVNLVAEHTDFDPVMPVYFGYSKSDGPSRNFRKLCAARFGLSGTKIYPVGATIGTHVGPGCIAVAYLAKTGFGGKAAETKKRGKK